jgi:hypothetical protein
VLFAGAAVIFAGVIGVSAQDARDIAAYLATLK